MGLRSGEVLRTLEVCSNSLRVSEPQGQERSAGDLAGSGTEDHWNDMAAYCQGVPITGCVPLPDYLGTLELELTKVDIW